jgi:hypothetical protein
LTRADFIRGDSLGLEFPTHSKSLEAAGTTFLTRAFRASGALPDDNSVTNISKLKEVLGGSTGRKALLSVQYAKPSPDLHSDLFVKFSRDFDDKRRDQAKSQMELEVLFGLLSRSPDFPIAVPICYFSDYHHDSGTGILITQRIAYGTDGIERHYAKCRDYQMPDPLGHYQALIRALARLAGTHKAGLLPDSVERYFPFDQGKLGVSNRAPYTPEQIQNQVATYAKFAANFPQLLPQNIRTDKFLSRLADEAPRFQALETICNKILQNTPDMIALCHWNAHVDNAWFWRNSQNQIECGLMDWGNTSQMNVAMAIWGCLSGAESDIWKQHLDELLTLFVTEFRTNGGPTLDLVTLKQHLIIYVAKMGLNWMLDTPLTLMKIPNLSKLGSRLDSEIQNDERARAQLLIMTTFLNLWEQVNMTEVINYLQATQTARA